jgi:hypothetical protein
VLSRDAISLEPKVPAVYIGLKVSLLLGLAALLVVGDLDRLGLDHGTLVVFDRRPEAPPLTERITFTTTQTVTGRQVTLLRA